MAAAAAASSSPPRGPLFAYTPPPLGSLDPTLPLDQLRLECMLYHEYMRHEFQKDENDNKWWFMVRMNSLASEEVYVVTPLPDARNEEIGGHLARFLVMKYQIKFVAPGQYARMMVLYPQRVKNTLQEIALPHSSSVTFHANNDIRESWPEWDILVPTHALTREEARNPPAQSILSRPEVREVLATWEQVYTNYAPLSSPIGPLVYTIGPTAEERLTMWSAHEHEEELAKHEAELKKKEANVEQTEATMQLLDEVSGRAGRAGMVDAFRRELERSRLAVMVTKGMIEKCNATRLRLAKHLLSIPGVVMDMANDPMCPWKGMKFFHGTPNPYLQHNQERRDLQLLLAQSEGVLSVYEKSFAKLAPGDVNRHDLEQEIEHARRAVAESKKNVAEREAKVYPCALSFSATYRGSGGRTFKGSAFLSPYFTKGFSYGGATPHIYTYKLRVDGPGLRFLDVRTDYLKSTFHDPIVDPFRHIAALAGIPHAEDPDSIKIRDEKARNLYELFKGTDIDGAVMNSDVEWIFFDAAKLLAWEPPPVDNSMIPNDEATSILTPSLLNHYDYRESFVSRALVDQASQLVAYVQRLVNKKTLDAFLQTHKKTTRIKLSDLPIARWTLDHTPETYISQFAVNRPTHSPLWVEQQEPGADGPIDGWQPVELDVIEVDYRALWRHFAPNGDLDDIWMADSIIEGASSGVSRKTPLPYHQLCTLLRMYHGNTHLLVHLPNGFVQIVPTIRSHRLDARMYRAAEFAGERPVESMPRRTLFRSFETGAKSMIGAFLATTANTVVQATANALAGSKRKVGEALAAAAASSSSSSSEDPAAKSQKLMSAGTGAKLCIV